MTFQSILIAGCGNIGGAMLQGWLAGGVHPARFAVLDPALPAAPDGVRLYRDPPSGPVDVLLLGIKPQLFDAVAPGLVALAGPQTLVLSIMAGVELGSLKARFPDARGVVRIMPNLAAALGKSPVALAALGLEAELQQQVSALLAPLGTPEWLPEAQFDLVTALAGSGPAFVYRFIDALAAGAAALGMEPGQAQRLALATVEGAAMLAACSADSPGELARKVASPGGTTEAGLKALDEGGVLGRLVEQTLRAARDRGAEMAAVTRGEGAQQS